MNDQIRDLLKQTEHSHNCRIIYACESGSRAWGFASPDSDFDVRFIYVMPLEWYLRLEEQKDTIELMTEDNVDLSGWELRKMLRLFGRCNLALNEWFDSPIVYWNQSEFTDRVRALIPEFFKPPKALHHYRSMAEKIADQEFNGSEIRVKKALYVLRSLIACLWIMERKSMPPTRFESLLELPNLDPVRPEILGLMRQKAELPESAVVTLSDRLMDLISGTRSSVAQETNLQVRPTGRWAILNEILQAWVLNTSTVDPAKESPD